MIFSRLFSGESYKGTFNYLDTQRKYEIARTIIYFAISISIFLAGYITTGTRKNLLTVVAVLGMLPASKSLVSVIMFCRFKSFKEKIDIAEDVLDAAEDYEAISYEDASNIRAGYVGMSIDFIPYSE